MLKNIPHQSWAHLYNFAYELAYGDFYKRFTDLTLEEINKLRLPQKSAKIVDFGAGTGRLSIPLAKQGYEVHAVEPCKEMVDELKKNADGLKNIHTHICKMEDFHSDIKFDLGLCLFTVTLYILDEDSLKKSISSVSDCIKKGGFFMIDVPRRDLFSEAPSLFQKGDNVRKVTMKRIDNSDIYIYNEYIKKGNEVAEDSFQIRYWKDDVILNLLEENGFRMEKDLSDEFGGTGSNYYLMKKV